MSMDLAAQIKIDIESFIKKKAKIQILELLDLETEKEAVSKGRSASFLLLVL